MVSRPVWVSRAHHARVLAHLGLGRPHRRPPARSPLAAARSVFPRARLDATALDLVGPGVDVLPKGVLEARSTLELAEIETAVDLGLSYTLAWSGDAPVAQESGDGRVVGTYENSDLHFFGANFVWRFSEPEPAQ